MTSFIFGFNYEFDLSIFKVFFYCFILGIYLRSLLIFLFKQNWLKSSSHLLSFSFLPVVGFLITSVISSNIALSLGMVGALSIIRFRTPVKNPFELVTYFLLITIGIVVNVNPSLALNFVFFITLLAVFYFFLNMSSFNLNTIDFYSDEVFILSIETTKKIDNENDNLGLIHFSQDNDKFVYVFKSKNLKDIDDFMSSISKDILTSYSIDK